MIAVILAEVLVGCVGCLAFVVLYGLRSPWRESPMGRHIMAFSAASASELGSLFALGMGAPVALWVFAIIFGLFDLVILQRLVLLWRAQRADASRKD